MTACIVGWAHSRFGKLEGETLEGLITKVAVDAQMSNNAYVLRCRATDEQVLIYNSFMSKRGWRDDETDGFIPDMIRQYGLKDDGSLITDFDLIEMDEGRWYPEMWRDAWK